MKQDWIPCSKKLPSKNGIYLVTEHYYQIDDRRHNGPYMTKVETVEYYRDKWGRAKFIDVVAWMPLPEPYREDNDGNIE